MFRVASIIAVILLGLAAGCRSVRPATVVGDRKDNLATRTDPIATELQSNSDIRSVAFVHAAERVDGPEVLPSANPDAREDSPLTLADLVDVAFQNNPTLATAAARMDVARGRQVQSGLYPNPVMGYHATEIGNGGTAGQQGAFISQRFITGGKLQLDQAIAGAEIDEAHFRFHAQQQRVLSDARVRFYDALVAQRRVELTNELARLGADLVKATETLIDGRLGTENDFLQAEIKADESSILRDNAQNELAEAWRRLAAVVGVPTLRITPLAGGLDSDLPSLDWDSCYAMLLDSNPELNAALAQAERASFVIHRAMKEPIPNVDVSISVRHHNVTTDDVANVQVGIPIPIFNKNEGNIRSAEAEWVAANAEVQRIELDLQDRLAVAYRRYANARQQVDRYGQRMIPKADRSLKLVTEGYERGQVKYLTLLTAQQTYLQVNLSFLDSLRALRESTAVIEGQLLTGSLKQSR
ncbi:MAG: TolC family protein [Planctomycetes bacterium]|nr:TolC family protein [Planctomycetota bacterium]